LALEVFPLTTRLRHGGPFGSRLFRQAPFGV
jgi:hypothetical protein